MRTTGTHRHHRGRHGSDGSDGSYGSYGSYGSAPRGAPMYYGWSHDESRMQMMDLPDYLDSFRSGYERALEDFQSQLANVAQAYMPDAYTPGGIGGYPTTGRDDSTAGRSGKHRRRHQRHDDHDDGCGCRDHDHHDHGCGCGHRDDCRCDCCIVDADYVIYARCFERRVVPIQIENDTRKVREDVTVEVSEARSSGGRTLPWKVSVGPRSTLTLEPCTTTEINVVVEIECGETDRPEPQTGSGRRTAAQKAAAAKEADEGEAAQRTRDFEPVDVDDCEVGYVTVRVGGCIVRPIVVAIAVLPRDCDAYHASCSCSCCC